MLEIEIIKTGSGWQLYQRNARSGINFIGEIYQTLDAALATRADIMAGNWHEEVCSFCRYVGGYEELYEGAWPSCPNCGAV